MARIKLRLGENEIEVDSRDFYVDNKTLGEVVGSLSVHLPENRAEAMYEPRRSTGSQYGLDTLDDVEAFEPEFSNPKHIPATEIKSKLRILETGKFFDSPRTVTEIVQQLREYGWTASPLDVSKVLAKMALSREIMKDSEKNRTHYFARSLTA